MHIGLDVSELERFLEEFKDDKNLEKYMKKAIKEAAKELIEIIKGFIPVGETHTLINGWDKRKISVTNTGEGYEVVMHNDVEYALAVNDGHMVYNQHGGPYQVKKRVKVPTPHEYQVDTSNWYVYGHFFVERGLAQYNNTDNLEKIIMENLEKWWDELG